MAFRWPQQARYTPAHPDAYVARHDWRSNGLIFALIAVFGVVALYLAISETSGVWGLIALLCAGVVYFRVRDVRAGVVALAVDAPGVFFGKRTSSLEDHEYALVPWALIRSVVLCEILQRGRGSDQQDHWVRAVGVQLDPEHWRQLRDRQAKVTAGQPLTREQRWILENVPPIDPHGNEVSALRLINGWQLDQAKLEEAVRRFAPTVPVVDGGQQDPPDALFRDALRLVRTLRPPAGGEPPDGAAR